mgnify:CR=1 FL=1
MKLDKKSKNYAAALMSAAKKCEAIDLVESSLTVINGLIKREPAFRSFFFTRRICAEKKQEILETVLSDRLNPMVSEFFLIIVRNRDYQLYPKVIKYYSDLRAKELELIKVVATTADELEESAFNSIKDRLEKVTEKQVDFKAVTDPEIVGGIRLRVGNYYIDGSLQGRLGKLKKELIQN